MDRQPSLDASPTRSNHRRHLKSPILLLLVAPVFVYETAFIFRTTRGLVLARNDDYPLALQLNAPLPPKTNNRTMAAYEAAECTTQSPESIRASGIHWTVDAVHANVSMYALSDSTLGVHISLQRGISPEVVRRHMGRDGLIAEQERIMMRASVYKTRIPKMTIKRDNRSAPDYDKYLGCAPGRTPSGVAVVVVQNFYCANVWHALANIQGVWMLLEIVRANTNTTVVLPKEYGSPFASPPKYLADLTHPLFIKEAKENINRRDMQSDVPNCFEQVLFIETGGYRPGPFWGYQAHHDKIFTRCARDSPFVRMQTEFRRDVQEAANEVLDNLGLHSNEMLSKGTVVRQVHVCYMSRRLRKGRLRYFTPQLEPIIEGAIDSWAGRQNLEQVSFNRLEFDESVPLKMQVCAMRQCTVLFGPHGAGLGHEIWMETEEGCIIEFGDSSNCQSYYRAMASWHGHRYICFSKLKGHKISMSEGMYERINETLLLEVLDSVVSKQLRHLSGDYD